MKSTQPVKNKFALEQFVIPLAIHPFDRQAAEEYGVVRASLEKKGTLIGPLDTMIAAHALSLDQILVTNNEKEFRTGFERSHVAFFHSFIWRSNSASLNLGGLAKPLFKFPSK